MIRSRIKLQPFDPIQTDERLQQAKALLAWLCSAASKSLSKDPAELKGFEREVQLMLSCLLFRGVGVQATFQGLSQDYVSLDIDFDLGDGNFLYVPVQFRLQP